MRVHQPGSHLLQERGVRVRDWSWKETRRRFSTLARLVAPYRGRAILSVLTLLLATGIALAPPFLAKFALDDAVNGDAGGKLYLIVALFLFAGLANWGMTYAQTYLTGWVGERMLADLRTTLFDHLQGLSLGFYERNRAGVIISRLTNDVEALDQLVTDGISTLVQSTLTLVGTAILLFILDWRLALATLAVIPVMSVGTVLFRRYSTRAYRAVRERLGLVTATLAEDIAGMRVVQAFTREQVNIRNFREVSERYRQSNQQTVVLSGWYFPFVDLLSTVALAIVLGYGGHLYFEGAVEIGTLFAFMLYVQNFFDPVQQLSQLYGTFLSATAALDKINDLLDEQPQVVDERGARDLGHLAGDVRFEGVRFAYGRGDEVLHGIDLDVPAGTTVALVGHTGAGQVDDREAARPLLRPDARPDHARRRRPAACHPGVAAPPARRRPAGRVPVRRLRSREHRVRAARRDATTRWSPPQRRSAPTTSSGSSRTATTPSWASAARASRSDSASWSRSRGRCSPTRASSCSTRRPRPSTSAPSGGSRSRCGSSSPAGRHSSSRIASRPFARPI